LTGQVYDVFDSTVCVGLNLWLYKDDSLYAISGTNLEGIYHFDSLSVGQFRLKAQRMGMYPGFYSVRVEKADTNYYSFVYGRIIPSDSLFFNEKDAMRDISNGTYRFLTWGHQIYPGECRDNKIKKLQKNYGFTYYDLARHPRFPDYSKDYPKLLQSKKKYNDTVKDHLGKIHGKGWYKKYLAEVNKIIKNECNE
jgi:hypothetical protein